MRLPIAYRQSCFQLFYDTQDEKEPAGSGFFASVPLPGAPMHSAVYAVTADHVIDEIGKNAVNPAVYCRVNRVDGGSDFFETRISNWLTHPDEARNVDVAACLFRYLDPRVYESAAVPLSAFVTDDVVAEQEIAPGDAIHCVALYRRAVGESRNEVSVRNGAVVSMPSDRLVGLKYGTGEMDAYLVELMATGGMSGGPVYVNTTAPRLLDNGTSAFATGAIYLLGIVHGHWAVRSAERPNQLVHEGVSIVTRAKDIAETLNQDSLLDQRRALSRQLATSEHADPMD